MLTKSTESISFHQWFCSQILRFFLFLSLCLHRKGHTRTIARLSAFELRNFVFMCVTLSWLQSPKRTISAVLIAHIQFICFDVPSPHHNNSRNSQSTNEKEKIVSIQTKMPAFKSIATLQLIFFLHFIFFHIKYYQ